METREEYLKRIRRKTTPFIIALLILLVCGLFLQRIFERRIQEKPPIKIYKTTQSKKTLDSNRNFDKETSITGAQTLPVETQSTPSKRVETPLTQDPSERQNGKETEVEKEKYSVENEDVNAETEVEKAKREAELAEWEEWNSEIDSILAESIEMQQDAKAAIAETIPHILAHLNTLTPQEQREFLRKTKEMMVSQSPPGLQEIADQNPELVENAWKMFIQMLVDQGYDYPRM